MNMPNITNLEVLIDKMRLLVANLSKQDKISRIDLDLLMDYTRQLYDLLLEAASRKSQPQQPAPKAPAVEKQPLPEQKPPKPATPPEAPVNNNEGLHEEIRKNLEEIKQQKSSIRKPAPAKPLVSDEEEEEDSLNDRFAKQEVLVDKLKKKPIRDLSKAIDLNDKFWFINELFDGNPSAFTEALDKLNRQSSLEEAMAVIEQEIYPKFNWEGKDRIRKKFMSFVERRFA